MKKTYTFIIFHAFELGHETIARGGKYK